jgi:DNA primase
LEPKAFRFRRADGEWTLSGVRRVLYHLPEVIGAALVIVVEGEKDVETLRSLGYVATCCSGGAGQWRPEYAAYLKGDVVIIPDNDEPGMAYAAQVARSVPHARLLVLPAKDVTEFIERGGELDLEMAIETKTWLLTMEGARVEVGASPSQLPTWEEAMKDWRKSVPRWSPDESYALVACKEARRRVEAATYGREQKLNDEALGLGYLVGKGWLEMGRAAGSLWIAAQVNGLVKKEGPERVQDKILRGLRDGPATRQREIVLKRVG